jgi:hypothetical protein
MNYFRGPMDITNQSGSFINELLSTYKEDLFGCLVNCSGKGKCLYTAENRFECKCLQLRSGVACENNLHPCASVKCLNDGKCYELPSFDGVDNLEVACNCSGLYYGSKCQEKINVCANEICSGHGACFENNSLPFCKCFSMYEGDKCETSSAALQHLRKKISIASYLAFFFLFLCYGIFICLDFVHIAMGKVTNVKKKFRLNVIRFNYKIS